VQKEGDKQTFRSMYCTAQINGKWIHLILDSGSSGSVVTKNFLEEIGRTIDRKCEINMVGIHGEKRQPLGEVLDLPIQVQDAIIPVNVTVTEATDYSVIVGNDWLTKCKASLSWRKRELEFEWNGKAYKEPATCWDKPVYPVQPLPKIEVVEDSDDEFMEEEEQEPTFFRVEVDSSTRPGQTIEINAKADQLEVNKHGYSWDYIDTVRKQQLEDSSTELADQPDEVQDSADCTCENCEEQLALHQTLELLTPDELRPPEQHQPGLTLKYFDNDHKGRKPEKAYNSDAGFDLYYEENEPLILAAGKITAVDTFIALEIPRGTYAQIASRSSLARKGINAVGGVCDAGYTGNIIVQLQNTTTNDIILQKHDKIAQLVFLPLVNIEQLQRVEDRLQLGQSERGTKGFGSSNQPAYHNEVKPAYGLGELTSNQQKQFDKLMEEYQDLFQTDLGQTNIVRHEIDTGQERPIHQPARPCAPGERKIIQKEIQDMLEKGVIRESNSPWTSPIVLVTKKDGAIRFCVDYRKLNKITRPDRHPLPCINDLLNSFGGATCFSTLDLASGYWQVEMDPRDREKTAFIVEDGVYEFNVMPFGLTNAPATFQRMMNRVFAGVNGQFIVVYLDDLNVYSRDFNEHLKHLREVFERLRQAGLRLKAKKCHFFKKELAFLGHVVGADGVKPDPDKIAAVKDHPVPKNIWKLRQFVGLASYYQKFVENFAKIAAPLNSLLRKSEAYQWTDQHQEAFETLKQRLISAPILVHPDFERPFQIFTDASAIGLGAILSQKDDQDRERVIRYASRRTSDTERNYSATNLECLGVVWAVKHFRKYVTGTHFQIITDHSAIKSLMKTSNPLGCTARWIIELQNYSFEIIHKSGRTHSTVDTLSRTIY
jgi:deoxyuridine 5'-triphosphate nucleotidohydrolase